MSFFSRYSPLDLKMVCQRNLFFLLELSPLDDLADEESFAKTHPECVLMISNKKFSCHSALPLVLLKDPHGN